MLHVFHSQWNKRRNVPLNYIIIMEFNNTQCLEKNSTGVGSNTNGWNINIAILYSGVINNIAYYVDWN
jgi:hypothetical protein